MTQLLRIFVDAVSIYLNYWISVKLNSNYHPLSFEDHLNKEMYPVIINAIVTPLYYKSIF